MPTNPNRQEHMEVFMGRMPAVDGNHYIDDMSFTMNVVAKANDYTVLSKESGTIFTTRGASGTVDFTLPTVAEGLTFFFYSIAAGAMKVTGATNLTIAFNDVTATSVSLETGSAIIGGMFKAVCDGTKWLIVSYLEESQTVTVA